MSRLLKNAQELQEAVQPKEGVFVLFYAAWCPYSQRFLPVFEEIGRSAGEAFVRILADEHEHLCDQYAIDVYPTVLFFKSGNVSKRLDGTFHAGLSEREMKDLVITCRSGS